MQVQVAATPPYRHSLCRWAPDALVNKARLVLKVGLHGTASAAYVVALTCVLSQRAHLLHAAA